MAYLEHLSIIKQGGEVWNEWRFKHIDTTIDLRGADLRNAELSGAYLLRATLLEANFSGATLRNANLFEADLYEANLSGADLRGADLRNAELTRANLSGANLSGVTNLTGATLRYVNLSGADLRDAALNEANLYEANLSRADLSRATLTGATLTKTDLSNANLSGANLYRAICVETNLTRANLTQCSIYGISAWNVQLEGATQDNLVITRWDEPTITVDDLEVAQFIYLLLNHKKLRNVLNTVTERGVLLLGRFGGGGLDLLQAIADRLRGESYLPIIFDFERPQDRNYTETVKTLAGLARFVIVDLSGPSVPQELYATIPHFKIPFVPIIEANRKPYFMSLDLLEYPWVVRPPVTFATTEELLELLPTKVIAPAEAKYQARQKLLEELFKEV